MIEAAEHVINYDVWNEGDGSFCVMRVEVWRDKSGADIKRSLAIVSSGYACRRTATATAQAYRRMADFSPATPEAQR